MRRVRTTIGLLAVAALVLLASGRWLHDVGDAGLPDGGTTPASTPRSAPTEAHLGGAPPSARDAGGVAAPERAPWAVTGRVVHPGRVPAPGATVRLFSEDAEAPDDTGVADAAGRFRLRPGVSSKAGFRMFRLQAEDGEGRVAAKEVYNVEVPRNEDVDARLLLLEPGHTLVVEVTGEGVPLAGADVDVEDGGSQGHVVREHVRTDDRGVARVEGLRPLLLRVRARADGFAAAMALVSLPQTEGVPLGIDLDRPRTVVVQVVEAPDGKPLAGVEVEVFNRIAWGRSRQLIRMEGIEEISPTDAEGRTRITGLGRSSDLHLGVAIRGYARPYYAPLQERWSPQFHETVPIPTDEDRVRVVVPAGRRVAWPLVEGDAPVPPEGTVVRLDAGRGGMRPWGVVEGVVEGGRLVVDGLEDAHFSARARTPDGLVARVFVRPADSEGPPIAFWRPRLLEVVLRDLEGAPVPRVSLKLDAEGGPQVPTPIAATDADGVARWTDLPALQGSVRIEAPPYERHEVDLRDGDQHIEARAEATMERLTHALAIRVHLEGRPGLPDEVQLGPGDFHTSVRLAGEDEAVAVLLARWSSNAEGGVGRIRLRASGYQPASFAVTEREDTVAVDLSRGCALHIALLHLPEQRFQYRIQREEASSGTWADAEIDGARRPGNNWKPLNPPSLGTQLDLDGLAPGRYRALDPRGGRTSEVALLEVGGPTPLVTLDCRPSGQVRGRIAVPPGYEVEEAVVEVETGGEWTSVRVDEEGRFAWPWSSDVDGARLVVRHPLLRPEATSGRVSLDCPREDVRLDLVEGPLAEVLIEVPSTGAPKFEPPPTVRVHVHPVGDRGGRWTVLPARLEAQARGRWLLTFACPDAGRWSVWADLGSHHAPIGFKDVAFDDLDASLGPVTLSRGSELRVRVQTVDGKPVELLVATAQHETLPFLRRMDARTDATEIVIQGLAAGRYHLTAGTVDSFEDEPPHDLDEVIDVDGRSRVERVVVPRAGGESPR